MERVIVVGGGAAGMMAASLLDTDRYGVTLIEKNEKLGKKLYITGKGRCNLTNACDRETFFENIIENKRFMYSSFAAFDNFSVIDRFESLGLKTKTERGNRVFPVSDHSSDVIKALETEIRKRGVSVKLNTEVIKLDTKDGRCCGVVLKDGTALSADAVILATGGLSYPSTGSTGEGFDMVRAVGHDVTKLYPSLCSVIVKEDFVKELEGLSLKNVTVTFKKKGKKIISDLGEMLFTDRGLSGPLILSGQAFVGEKSISEGDVTIHIDLKPALDEGTLEKRIIREFEEEPHRQFGNVLRKLLPARLTRIMALASGIASDREACTVTKAERARLVGALKDFEFHALRSGGFGEAVVTRGGVEVGKVDPKTMGSKLCPGLYIAGEMLDVDAFTGGFNLQIAWSTGAAAARAVNNRP
ncbi:MAG: NAD(P)/FAD-dependent oxidoreductase [Lachnospiraceae bacterium]|nr:NAD(P)/FAD-dependent oxidoreductase [Lachnospiraceae bacterium]